MNIADLYAQLEEKRKLIVYCPEMTDFYAVRTGVYRARRRQLEAFNLIDDTGLEDGFKLTVRRNSGGTATLELSPKESKRQWTILEDGVDSDE